VGKARPEAPESTRAAMPARSEMSANLLIGKKLDSDDFSEWPLRTKANLLALQTAP
jgi:hypothetical protein